MDDKQAVRGRILDAASQVFARDGFAGARVERIARLAGVNKAGLYYHVGNKARLFEEVMIEMFSRMAESLEQAVASRPDPAGRLDALVRAMARAFDEGPARARIMLVEVARGGLNVSEKVMAQVERVFACTAAVVGDGVRAGVFAPENPFYVHMCLVGSLSLFVLSGPMRAKVADMGLAAKFGVDPVVPLQAMAGFLSDMLARGLAAPAGAKDQGRRK